MTIVLCGQASVSGFTNGHCQDALFAKLVDVVVSGSTAFVSDAGNNVIRSISLTSGVVATLCGSPSGAAGLLDSMLSSLSAMSVSLLDTPMFLTVSGSSLVFTQAGSSPSVRTVDISSGSVTTLAGSSLFYSASIAVGDCGYVSMFGPTGIIARTSNDITFIDGALTTPASSLNAAQSMIRTLSLTASPVFKTLPPTSSKLYC